MTLKGGGSLGEQPYVPRAMWTEAVDSPMKLGNRTEKWDPHQFLREEAARTQGKERLGQYLTSQRGHQTMERLHTGEAAGMAATLKLAATLSADALAASAQDATKATKAQELRQKFREGLDEQARDLAQRERDMRTEEAKEGAEMRLRNMQQMCLDLRDEERKRALACAAARLSVAQMKASEKARREETAIANEQARSAIAQNRTADERRAGAEKKRVEDKQREMQFIADRYLATAGAAEEAKRQTAELREDTSERKMLHRQEEFYLMREQARASQKANMVRALGTQKGDAATSRGQEKRGLEEEKSAAREAYRTFVEQEVDKTKSKRTRELQNQREIQAMIAEKYSRELAEGSKRNLATNTMAPAADALSANLMSSVDAARHVGKPLGRFSSTGAVGSDLPGQARALGRHGEAVPTASAPKHQSAHSSVAPAVRVAHVAAHWHEGLNAEELKAGRAAARRRLATSAQDKADA